jgi:thiamine biosynthesis lipoprotein
MTHTQGCLLLLFFSGAAAPGGLAQGVASLERYTFAEKYMGTLCRIVVYASSKAAAQGGAQAAFERISALDSCMSDYRPTSELMQLCSQAGGPPRKVSSELFFVLEQADKVSRLSDGAFDVTVGPLSRLWRRVRRSQEPPTPEELTQARARVGYRLVKLDKGNQTVQLLKPHMQLDLGGIAKGYAADEALAVLQRHGLTRALVAMGGDIAVSDAPPDAPGWNIGIAPLEAGHEKPKRTLVLKNAAVSTSGDAEQYVEIGGKRYSHIVDPRTGLGLVGRQSVTVTARRGVTADSWTKVVSVLGPERGMPLIEALDGAACYVVKQTETGQRTWQSSRFAEKSTATETNGHKD